MPGCYATYVAGCPEEGVTGLPPEKEGTGAAAGCQPLAGELGLVGAEMERLRAVCASTASKRPRDGHSLPDHGKTAVRCTGSA